MDDILELYKEEIFKLAEEKKDNLFYNSSEEHATIVHQAIAKTAEHDINILSSSLCSSISNNDDYLECMRCFFSKDSSHFVRVVLTDYNEEFQKKPIASLFREFHNQVELRRFNGVVKSDDKQVHFTYADDRMYRIETDIVKHIAFGNFNSPSRVAILASIFDKVFSRSEELELNN